MPYRLAIAQNCSRKGWIKGFEPLASRATIWRANQLRYTHHINMHMKMQACLEGFEPPTHGLEGRCSIQLSYWYTYTNKYRQPNHRYDLTIEVRVGVTGFEPATS